VTPPNPPAKKPKSAEAEPAVAEPVRDVEPPVQEVRPLAVLDRGDRERLLGGAHHEPHAVLGAHPVPGGVVFRALRPYALSVTVVTGELRAELHDDGEGLFSAVLPLREVPAYRLLVEYEGESPGHRGRVPVPAHDRRVRSASVRRGPARAAVEGWASRTSS
jgi:1,4-alpha-glucan branching enzyme